MADFFSLLLSGIADMFYLLDRLPVVSGVSVLDFLIAIVVISVIMPVLLTIVRSMNSSRNVRVDRHGDDRKNED